VAKEDFERCLNFVFRWEGEYSNDKDDPGGLTIYGISSRSFPDAVKRMEEYYKAGKKAEAKEIAKGIYKKYFWDKIKGDGLAKGWDLIVFDTAVNMGVETAKELMHIATTKEDYLLLRIKKYALICRKNPKMQKFLLGWINRVVALYEEVKKYDRDTTTKSTNS